MSVESNVLGDFAIVKDVFNSSARSSEENKCAYCSKKGGGSRGTKDSRGQPEKDNLSESGNQIFKRLSPKNSLIGTP